MTETEALRRRRQMEKEFKSELEEEKESLQNLGFTDQSEDRHGLELLASINVAARHSEQRHRQQAAAALSEGESHHPIEELLSSDFKGTMHTLELQKERGKAEIRSVPRTSARKPLTELDKKIAALGEKIRRM